MVLLLWTRLFSMLMVTRSKSITGQNVASVYWFLKELSSKTETCPVAVKALISGRFEFPEGFQLISALYAISPGRKFTKDVKITLQHCFLIQRAEQLKRLCIVKAYPTKPDNPYVFEIVKGGVFKFGSQYCEVWLSDFQMLLLEF